MHPLYDDAVFFDGYACVRENPLSANDVLEIPAMQSLLPGRMDGLRVLDLGCGVGSFCRYLVGIGASSVIGVDVSERMLQKAREAGDAEGRISYTQASIEDYAAPAGSLNLVVSSLALHYVADVEIVFARISRWLAPGGIFIFSTEHPLTTASRPPFEGWERDNDNQRVSFRVNHYFDEGLRVRTWIVEGVRTYHRTLSTYINTLVGAGFVVGQVVEPTVTPHFAAQHPAFQCEYHRPLFLCVQAKIDHK